MRRMRSACCARAASGHRRCRTAKNTEKFPPPHVRPRAQDKASYRLRRGGNKRHVDVREVMNGIMYVLSTGASGERSRKTFRRAVRCTTISTCGATTATAVEGLPRIGKTSIARRWHSCVSHQSASCSENFVIQLDVSGRILRVCFEARSAACGGSTVARLVRAIPLPLKQSCAIRRCSPGRSATRWRGPMRNMQSPKPGGCRERRTRQRRQPADHGFRV